MVFHHFVGGSEEKEETDKPVSANVGNDNKKATNEFWVKLQAALSKDDTTDAKFLENTDNKLQPYLDIIFFKYWDTEKLRKDSERYISVEQSLRFFDDLVRGNEDAAIPALKDYVKFKLVSGADANDTIKDKKAKFIEAKKNGKLEEIDKAKKSEIADKMEKAAEDAKKSCNAKDLDIIIAEAKVFEVDAEAVTKAEEASKEAKEAKDKKDNDRIAAITDKAKDKGEDAVTKAGEKAEAEKKKVEEAKEKVAKEVEEAGAKNADAKKEFDEDKTKQGEAAEKAAGDEFTTTLKDAVDKCLKKMENEYKKRTFILRNAACAAFLEGTTAGLSEEEGKTITGNDLNKLLSISAPEKFDGFCAALGFKTDDFDAVAAEMPEEKKDDEEKKEGEEEKKE